MMRGIRSTGGPLLCVERRLALTWHGINDPILKNGQLTDYERACRVEGFLGKIEVGTGSGLVLNDMPLQTFVLDWRDTALLVRLYYADPDFNLDKYVSSIEEAVFVGEEIELEWAISTRSLMIFDSALEGKSLDRDVLEFDLRPGVYRVVSKSHTPDERTSVLLHRFYLL